jgi:hypothetical protein
MLEKRTASFSYLAHRATVESQGIQPYRAHVVKIDKVFPCQIYKYIINIYCLDVLRGGQPS